MGVCYLFCLCFFCLESGFFEEEKSCPDVFELGCFVCDALEEGRCPDTVEEGVGCTFFEDVVGFLGVVFFEVEDFWDEARFYAFV